MMTTDYRSQAEDTNIEADIYFFDRLRKISLQQRVKQVTTHNIGIRKLCLAGIKLRHQRANIEEICLYCVHLRKKAGSPSPKGRRCANG